jgi:hypothetical protein
MAQMLNANARRRPFARADILSLLGETICQAEADLTPRSVPPRSKLQVFIPPPRRPAPPEISIDDCGEEAERWDGMS